MPGQQARSPSAASACQQSQEFVTAEDRRQLPDQCIDRTTPQSVFAGKRTGITGIAPGQSSQSQIGQEQQLPRSTPTVRRSCECRNQTALGQVSNLPIQSGRIATAGERYQVRDGHEW